MTKTEFKINTYTKEDAYQTLTMINSWISNIDTKISFALAFVGILIGTIFSSGIPKSLQPIFNTKKLSDIKFGQYFAAAVIIILLLMCLAVIINLLLGMKARVKEKAENDSIIYFGAISKKSLGEYQSIIGKINETEMLDDLTEQIYINSKICTKKANFYNNALIYLIISVLVWFISKTLDLL